MKRLSELSEAELLALAIANEEEDGRIYGDFAHALRDTHPATAAIFTAMAAEEGDHRRRLIDLYVQRFGDHIPLFRRQDVRGNIAHRPHWQVQARGVDAVRRHASEMERAAEHFYRAAAGRMSDAGARRLLGDLADAEARHGEAAVVAAEQHLPEDARAGEDREASRRFLLQVVQPGLVGLMDGSVSTLAPVFAAAFATHDPFKTFLVGLAASLGAGISMGFAEGLADDGRLSGRGTPLVRGLVCGLMTVLGGIGHTLPYLIPNFVMATAVAAVVVMFELLAIAWIQWRYMQASPLAAIAKVMLGGGLVLATGIAIGAS